MTERCEWNFGEKKPPLWGATHLLAEVGRMIHGEFVSILKNDASLEDDRQRALITETNISFNLYCYYNLYGIDTLGVASPKYQ